MNKFNEHGCDHDCNIEGDHDLCLEHIVLPFQDAYDSYITKVSEILNDKDKNIDDEISKLLHTSLELLDHYKDSMQDLEVFKQKFTPEIPLDLRKSTIKHCLIGRCRCGQVLVQSRHVCCPRCQQFVKWELPE